ncbi:hypothetical protein [Vibrio phage VCPH]|nr:hypothetical protein [Vibrio phage VCPH]
MAKARAGQIRYWIPSKEAFPKNYEDRFNKDQLLVVLRVDAEAVVYKFVNGGAPRMAVRNLFEAFTDVYF